MGRWLKENFSLIIVSVLLAFFFWAVATESENPTVERLVNGNIPLSLENQPEDMVTYNLDTTRVRVELRAPQSVWNLLTPDDVHAFVDLSMAATGTITLPVQVNIELQPIRIVSITPPEVKFTFEPLTQKDLPVVVAVMGAPALGYQAKTPIVAPQTVRVQGPASLVNRVAQVRVEVPVDDAQRDVLNDYALTPLDENNVPVPNVEIMPKTVTANVPIEQLDYVRDLAVNVLLDGQPAPDYSIAELAYTPRMVKVSGPPDIVRAVPGFLQTLPVNIEGITRSLTTTVALQMPEGLSLITPAQPWVTASLRIEAVQSGKKLDISPEITGLHKPFTATVGIESVVVLLNGPLNIIDTLPITDVKITLDLTNLTPGDYNLTPIVNVPAGVVVQNLLPETVPVKIAELPPMPTPTATLTATLTLTPTLTVTPTIENDTAP